MNAFWPIAALLCRLAIAFVLWPLRRRAPAAEESESRIRREENLAAYRARLAELEAARAAGTLADADFELQRLELDRRLLEEAGESEDAGAGAAGSGRRGLLAVAILLPVFALLAYQYLGAARDLHIEALLVSMQDLPEGAQRDARMAELLPLLEAEARRDKDGGYRIMLADIYMGAERFPEAAGIYSDLVQTYPEDAEPLARQAQALYLAAGRRITPAVQELIDRSFAIEPAQPGLLGLVGMDRFQAGDYAAAVTAWEKLLAQLPAEAPDAAVIRQGIGIAKSKLGETAGTAAPAEGVSTPAGAPAPTAAPDAAAGLEVAVSLAPGLEAAPGDAVFVFARAVSGPPMPLAIARFPASELPRTVRLDDSMAMAPGMRLSAFPEVTVVARVSKSGNAQPQPGDLQGESTALSTAGAQSLSLTIDRRL
ncbi:MAG: c-type cytochrome biogenesis protein CcmI [Gammaproteobacteria bacterium]